MALLLRSHLGWLALVVALASSQPCTAAEPEGISGTVLGGENSTLADGAGAAPPADVVPFATLAVALTALAFAFVLVAQGRYLRRRIDRRQPSARRCAHRP